MKLQKVLASSLLCAVCCLSFKAQKTSANKETEKLPLHSISTEELNDNITLKRIDVSYIDSQFDESEFSLVTEEDTKLPEEIKYNMFYVTEDIELKNSIDDSSETVTIIPKGTLVEVELSGDAFSKVNFEDKQGIIKADVLTKNEVKKDEDKSENKDDSNKEENKEETNKEQVNEAQQETSKETEENKPEQVNEKPQQETSKEEPQQEKQKVTLYATDVLNVRENPSTSSNRLGTLNKADEVTGFDEGDWISFDFNGKKAYVMKAYLSSEKPVIEQPKQQQEQPKQQVEENKQEQASIPTDSNKVETVVNAALAQVGKAYVWASSNPNVGFDCSGLTYYAFKQAGINLNRVAADQYANGTPVSRENLMRGDLVFFSYGGGIGHVGLYIGNGKFVHASTYSTGVIVSDLSGYYLNVYAGAVRVIK